MSPVRISHTCQTSYIMKGSGRQSECKKCSKAWRRWLATNGFDIAQSGMYQEMCQTSLQVLIVAADFQHDFWYDAILNKARERGSQFPPFSRLQYDKLIQDVFLSYLLLHLEGKMTLQDKKHYLSFWIPVQHKPELFVWSCWSWEWQWTSV